ncbi:MAG: hypothetical protein MJ062_04155 [Oscillospiraceae bacterium]|nr:hypothetical protein [Oscillospiraceae bacterium]
MGLFGSYENAGAGINPYAPKKKPFARFWELLWRNSGKIFLLNVIFSGFQIPMMLALVFYIETNNKLTVPMCILLLIIQAFLEGPVMAGCARVLRLCVLDKAFFLWEEFKKGFQQNVGVSVLVFAIDLLVAASVWCGWHMYPQLAENTGSKIVYVPFVISLAVALVVLFMNFFLLPMQVATKLSKKNVFKNSFMLACLSPKTCVLTFVCIAVTLALCVGVMMLSSYLMFIFVFFPAAFIGYTVMFINYPVIQRYVIKPYYESSGEQNPEADPVIPEEERIFTDRGGSETPIKKEKSKRRGKTIS